MDKAKTKCRDIMFRSDKNQKVLCVHSAAAREYAKVLEMDSKVVSYEVCVELDRERYPYVDSVDIRKEYFSMAWATDFKVSYADGHIGICEIAVKSMLEKRATIEKLEFSRRYWSTTEATEWKLILMEKGE